MIFSLICVFLVHYDHQVLKPQNVEEAVLKQLFILIDVT